MCTDPDYAQGEERHSSDEMAGSNKKVLKINEFQLCKKGEIQQDKIEIQMRIQTSIPDDELMDDCVSLMYSVEIGELHERDKFQWIEPVSKPTSIKQNKKAQELLDQGVVFQRVRSMDIEFGMNHIKQVLKLEVTANIKKRSESIITQQRIYCAYFSYARCIRKSGQMVAPNSVGFSAIEDINVQVSLKEKLKYGGYRCITLRVYDTKGGDFVENDGLTMVVCEAKKQTPLAEVTPEIPLITSPEGFYKRVDIGVNNYDP